jgi:hypothetical protein
MRRSDNTSASDEYVPKQPSRHRRHGRIALRSSPASHRSTPPNAPAGGVLAQAAFHAPLAERSAPMAACSSSTRSMSSQVVSGLASTARNATTGISGP